ncbi:MAG TPA: DUF2505 domain-containing protein [Mycobacteriales bacterium]|jgi:hypothetical protein|nr:DUF2505 domain-containing protein [Mycobacteriales bacterium]
MKLRIEHDYAADVETVYALISDPDYIERKYVAIGGRDVAADRSDGDDGGCEVVTKRTVAVDLPGFAKKVLTPSQTTVQTEVWSAAGGDGVRRCTYDVDVQGAPGNISGSHVLSPSAGGSHHVIDIEIKVSVPLIGGRLEKLAAETGRGDIERQFDHTDEELAKI